MDVENFWMKKRTDISILDMLNMKIRLAVVCKQRIVRFFRHIIRKDGSSLEKLIIEGKIEEKMNCGRTPIRWIDQIMIITSYPLVADIRSAENRELWKEIVANAERSPNFRFWKMDSRRRSLIKFSVKKMFVYKMFPNKFLSHKE